MWRAAVVAVVTATWTAAVVAQNMPAPTPMASANRWSLSAEAFLIWFKNSPTPVPIITDSYADAPGVNVLLGGGEVDTNPNAGFRLTGTYRVDSRWGLEMTGFYVPTRSTTSSVSSSGQADSIDLYLPYFDVTTGKENITEISYRPTYRGSAQATLSNNLGGAEINATWSLPAQDALKVDLIGGFRFLQLRETYTIDTSSPNNPPNPADIWNTTDSFDARNRFYGLQFGARLAYDQGPWVGWLNAKVALGTMQQRVSVNGYLETNDYTNYGPTRTYPGGYFALPTNSGEHARSTFAAVPEIGFNLGYRLNAQATVFVGYSLLYVTSVVRPGDQMNRNVNPTMTVSYGNDPPVTPSGPAQPTFAFNTSDFWAQSLSIGFAYRF